MKSEITKLDDGNIEIVFFISADLILKTKDEILKELVKEAEVAGFRKGKAPISKVEEITSEEKLTEHILSQILPNAFADSVKEHKLKPAIYPKFSATKITSSKNVSGDTTWEIKAVTCELPKVVLGNYKKKLKSKTTDDLIKELTKIIKLDIPRILIEEEVNERLSKLLERIEKLGLTLEGYLKSVAKDAKTLREDYEKEAKSAISLELILNEIANTEKIDVDNKKIDEFIKTTGSDPEKVTEEQRKMLKRVVIRREALENLQKKV